MMNLSGIGTGQICRVKWMIGQVADEIRSFCHMEEDDTLRVVSNCGAGSVIVAVGNHRYAMDSLAASTIKVDPEAG